MEDLPRTFILQICMLLFSKFINNLNDENTLGMQIRKIGPLRERTVVERQITLADPTVDNVSSHPYSRFILTPFQLLFLEAVLQLENMPRFQLA